MAEYATERSDNQVIHDDLAEILRALGIGDHARPYSPHEVVQREILPAIRRRILLDPADERAVERVAEVIWATSRADESTISATGAQIVARAVLAELGKEDR